MDFDVNDILMALGAPNDITDAILTKYEPYRESLILEAGAGTGKLGINLAVTSRCMAVLVDNDKEQLARIQRYLGAVEALLAARLPIIVKEGDLEALPFNDGIFDMVFNEGVIEHFPDPLVPLKEMVRVSSDYVICIVPNAMNLEQARQAKEQMEKHAGTDRWEAFEKPMTLEELQGHFVKAGLKEVSGAFVWANPSPPQGDYNYRLVLAVGRKA